ncbi:uncharacterized protein K02A2.6-like [Actinia tenebrosa]|uniref:Uncharacterized protein K02A2.6-like n=1 Tax=Actinia tenebrosa TaxID=6105 RepID=A0A6P8GYF9_ACTTE|nr:uncharacterized protein K02A2.6-like [Actinia tenebrosa]
MSTSQFTKSTRTCQDHKAADRTVAGCCSRPVRGMPTGEHLLVVVDYYTRFYEVVIMNSVTANSIIKALEPIFARYGYPLSIRTDNGPRLVAETFETYLKQNGIEHRGSTPYWPQANGEVERQNRSLLKAMKTAKSQGKDWRQEIIYVVVKSQDGIEYKRNTSHMKLLKEETKEVESELEVPELAIEKATHTATPENEGTTVQQRPKRDRRPPAYLKDYALGQ